MSVDEKVACSVDQMDAKKAENMAESTVASTVELKVVGLVVTLVDL